MSKSLICSPAQSQNSSTRRKQQKAKTRSVGSPASNATSVKLSELIRTQSALAKGDDDSFILSPMKSRMSMLSDNTDIEAPKRKSWWKRLEDDTAEVMTELQNKKARGEPVEDVLQFKVLSPEKNASDTEDVDSSENTSIDSIVVPPKRLLKRRSTNQTNIFDVMPQIRASSESEKTMKEKTITVPRKNLFRRPSSTRTQPYFPSNLLYTSQDSINSSKSKILSPVPIQKKPLFTRAQSTEIKINFADLINSKSEDETPKTQPKLSLVRDSSESEKTLQESTLTVAQRNLFRRPSTPRKQRFFPSDDLHTSQDSINSSKSKTMISVEPPRRPIFSRKPSTETNINYADFISKSVGESQSPTIQSKFFWSNKKGKQKTQRESMRTMSIDEWKNLPSSTMMDLPEYNNMTLEDPSVQDIIDVDDYNEFEDRARNINQIEKENAQSDNSSLRFEVNELKKSNHEDSVKNQNNTNETGKANRNNSYNNERDRNITTENQEELQIEDAIIDVSQNEQSDNDNESEKSEDDIVVDEEQDIEEIDQDGSIENELINENSNDENEIDGNEQNDKSCIDVRTFSLFSCILPEIHENKENEQANKSGVSENEMDDNNENEMYENEVDEINENNANDMNDVHDSDVNEINENDQIGESDYDDNGQESNDMHDSDVNKMNENDQIGESDDDDNGQKSDMALVYEVDLVEVNEQIDKAHNTDDDDNAIQSGSATELAMQRRHSSKVECYSPRISSDGSEWDSHRQTRHTIRQTFGRKLSRQSIHAFVLENEARRKTGHGNATMKKPLANSTEFLDSNDINHEENEARKKTGHGNTTMKKPLANSTEFLDTNDINHEAPDSVHEISSEVQQSEIDAFLAKMTNDIIESGKKLDEKVKKKLEPKPRHPLEDAFFRVPDTYFKGGGTRKSNNRAAPKPKSRKFEPAFLASKELPKEIIKDLQYKPPKRYKPRSCSWVTKSLYKYLEEKLQPKYNYKARIRAECLVKTIVEFTKQIRPADKVAPQQAIDDLKTEMARLGILKTHSDFYKFFRDYMPKEICCKVIPDIVNGLPSPRYGIYSDILDPRIL